MTRKIYSALSLAFSLALSACGGSEPGAAGSDEDPDRQAQLTCYAYLLDQANYSGPLAPFPVVGPAGCINLAPGTDNRTSSFRLAGCGVTFYDYANCQGTSYSATTSGVMPPFMDNRASSLKFF